jgi:predicted phage tail protein
MLSKIRVYGRLAKFLGQRVFEADVASAAEAVRFLVVNFPQLEEHMADQHYRVSVGSYDLTLDELHDPAGQQEIKVVPVLAGAGPAGRIIAGVALVALSFFLPGAQIGLFGLGQIGLTALAAPVLSIGASLVLGGVAQLLTPTPKVPQGPNGQVGADSQNDPRKSYSFSGIQQTSRQGVPVPIVYGETLVGSVVISAGIDTVQVVG